MPQGESFTSPHFISLNDPMDLSHSHVPSSSVTYQSINLHHSPVCISFHPWTQTYSPCWARQVTSAITFLHLDLEKVLILFLCNKLHERIHPAPLQGTWENIKLYLTFRGPCIVSIFVSIYFQRDATLHSLFIYGKMLYMFRVVSSPIIRSTYNCIYSIWYLLTVRDKNE